TKHLDGLDAWVTGLRRDQWATRTNIRKVEIDHDHGAIVKLNPLAEWTKREVWAYLGEHNVPVHGLYAQGYTSIGCAPCTRAIGRLRGIYGPEGEQAALKTFRRLPGGRALSESAAEVSEALSALEGKTLEHVKVQATGPGSFLVTLGVEGLELSVRLDRAGARIHTVGV